MAESLKKSFGLIKVDIHFNFLVTYSLPPQEFEYFSWGFNIVKKNPENRQVYTTKSMWNFRLQIKLWQVKSLNQSMVLWNCTCHYHLKYCNFERCCGNEFRYILKHMYSITAFQPFSRLWFSRLVKFMLFSVSIHVTNHAFLTWMFFTPLWRTIKNSGWAGSRREDRLKKIITK